MNRKLAAGLFGMACLAMAAMPSTALAQGRQGGRGGRGGGYQANQPIGEAQAVLATLDLSDDDKAKIKTITDDAMKQVQEDMQGMRDQNATQEDRAAKMKDMQTVQTDTVSKIADALPDDKKPVFASKYTDKVVTNGAEYIAAVGKTAETFDTSDDNKAAIKTLVADTTKKFDGFKTDAASVKDMAASKELTTKVTDTMTDVNKQLRDMLGQDARQFMGAVRQNMPNQGRNAGGAGGGGGRRNTATPPTTAPTL
jgi:hypothetical protein